MVRKLKNGVPVRRTGDDRDSGSSGYSGNGLPSSSRGLSPAEREALLNSQNGNTSLGGIDMGNIGKPGAPILSYVDLINALSSVDPYFAQLAHLVTGGSDPSQYDWNKELLDTMLQLYLTKENRQYNEGIRDEQRLFDSPTNQLARLMGAGIGRDAAIQMISGSGSGSGSTGAFSEASTVQSAIPGSQSYLNGAQGDLAKTQQALGVANTVFSAIGTASGLVNMGFSSAQAFQQLSVLKNSAYLTDQQRKAYDAASGAFSVLSSAGIKNSADVFGSIDKTVSSIEDLAANGNAAAKQFIDSGGINQLRQTSPYSAPFLNQLYRNERDSSDYASRFSAEISQIFAQTDLANANRDHLRKGIEVMGEQIVNLRSDSLYKDALASLTGQQIDALDMENQIQYSFLNSSVGGKTGLELYTDSRLMELYMGVSKLSYLNDNDSWKEEADSLLASYENATVSLELSTLYAEGAFDAVDNSDPEFQSLLYFCRAAKECGYFDYIDSKVKAGTGRHISGPFGIGLDIGVSGGTNAVWNLNGQARKRAKRLRNGQ